MKTALVTAIGSFSADIVIRRLTEMGIRVVGCDIYPREWIANASMVDRFYNAPLAADPAQYLTFIQNLCLREQVSYLIPSTDVEVDVLDRCREWFPAHGVKLCLSSHETIALCRNKARMAQFTSGLDYLRTIPTVHMRDAGPDSLPPFDGFPLIGKPLDGRSSQGLHRIHTPAQWQHFCTLPDLENYIVQPLIQGSVVTVDVVRQADGEYTAVIPRQEMLRTLNGAGTSVYVFSDPELEQVCVRLADALKIIGCVCFEFMKDAGGNYHFIECNPRFSGGVAFSCVAGYDCVRNHIAAFEGNAIAPRKPFRNQYIVKKYHEHVTHVEE